ncbi:MAG: hypothetical protein RIR00_1382 [Pseudomonadota bacterium]|jgi:hypothetical protein
MDGLAAASLGPGLKWLKWQGFSRVWPGLAQRVQFSVTSTGNPAGLKQPVAPYP